MPLPVGPENFPVTLEDYARRVWEAPYPMTLGDSGILAGARCALRSA